MANDAMQSLRDWLNEYWERGPEDIALAQWSVTARYRPEKAEHYLAQLISLLNSPENQEVGATIAAFGIDLTASGDDGYLDWLRREVEGFTQVLQDQRMSTEELKHWRQNGP